MLLKSGDNNKRVRSVQETILAIDPSALPRYGADSDLGKESLGAIARLLKTPSIERAGLVDHQDQQRLLDLVGVSVIPPKGYIDNRKIANVLQRKHIRSPTATFDFVYHQADCEMGEKPSRFVDSSAHFFVTSGGLIIQLHDLEWLTHHAHALNETTIGIEIEGAFLGVEGDLKTWAPYHTKAGTMPQRLTQAAIDAATRLVLWTKAYLEKRGGRLRSFYAHRQGSNTRDRDPGSAIWQFIVLPIAELAGCTVPFSAVFGKGKTIPGVWDKRSKDKY